MACILVIDDVPNRMKLLIQRLQGVGHNVVLAKSSEDSLRLCGSCTPDCVLVANGMPTVHGKAVHVALKELKRDRFLPVILVLAETSVDDVVIGLDTGADDCLVMPLEFPIVDARIRSAIRRGESIDELILVNLRLTDEQLAARNADHVKSDFLASMSHELRTPLNAIIGFSQGLLERTDRHPLNDHQKDRLGKVLASGQHLLLLINDLLDLAKVESGNAQVHYTTEDLRVVASEVSDMASALLDAKPDVVFECDLPDGEMLVNTDHRKLKQVLINLLSNATKFTTQGSIRLAIKPGVGRACITLTDTGIGIPADQLDRAFDKFHQVQSTTDVSLKSTNMPGTGLGLALSKTFVDLLKGSIHVESTQGVGTTFEVWIPNEPLLQ